MSEGTFHLSMMPDFVFRITYAGIMWIISSCWGDSIRRKTPAVSSMVTAPGTSYSIGPLWKVWERIMWSLRQWGVASLKRATLSRAYHFVGGGGARHVVRSGVHIRVQSGWDVTVYVGHGDRFVGYSKQVYSQRWQLEVSSAMDNPVTWFKTQSSSRVE